MFISKKKLEQLLAIERAKVYKEQDEKATFDAIYRRIDNLYELVDKTNCALQMHIEKSKKNKKQEIKKCLV